MHRRTFIQAGIAGTVAALLPHQSHATPLPMQPALIVCIGNSITDCYPDAIPWHYVAAQDERIARHAPAWVNTAVRTYDISGIAQRIHPHMIAPLLNSWQGQKIAVVFEGTNELVQTRNPRVCFDRHAAYCDMLRSMGAKVVLGTILHRSYVWPDFDHEAARLEFNDIARAQWRLHADALMDVAQDGRLNSAPDPLYFMDHTHPNSAGQRVIAGYAADAIAPLLSLAMPQAARLASCLMFPLVTR